MAISEKSRAKATKATIASINDVVTSTGINVTKGVVEDATDAGDDIVPITSFDSTLG